MKLEHIEPELAGLTIDDLTPPEVTPDIAAARSQGYEFGGKDLAAFSKTRQVAAESMGVKICSPSFSNCAEEMAETGTYAGMFMDAVAIVWLCAHPVSASFKAARKPDAANNAALQWWDSVGGDIGTRPYLSLIETYGSIISDLYAVAAETDSSGRGTGQSLGE